MLVVESLRILDTYDAVAVTPPTYIYIFEMLAQRCKQASLEASVCVMTV